jgi:RNA polymerase sigma-70 factor (ECF subfamily)
MAQEGLQVTKIQSFFVTFSMTSVSMIEKTHSLDSEQKLILASKEGNAQAFGALVKRYEKYVFTLAIRMLKTREDAEEVAQDTFIKAFRSINQYREDGKFVSWLYTIAYRESLNKLRSVRLDVAGIDNDDFTESWESEEKTGLEVLTAKERIAIVRTALDALRPAEAAVLTLFYLDEQCLREICMITGMTESNVKVLLFRGRRNLRSVIQSMNPKPAKDWL